MKSYDEKYFRRWYRDALSRITHPAERARRVNMAVAVTEYVLGRRLRSVLDVGCGEGRWRLVLRRARPSLRYVGVDSSEYVVRRFGRTRGIIMGTFAQLDRDAPKRKFDLVVASDVLHYLGKEELEQGAKALACRVGGIAYLDFFTSRDVVEGDLNGMMLRSPDYYVRLMRRNGLRHLGMHFFAPRSVFLELGGMERHHG